MKLKSLSLRVDEMTNKVNDFHLRIIEDKECNSKLKLVNLLFKIRSADLDFIKKEIKND